MNIHENQILSGEAARTHYEKELWSTEDVMRFFDKGRTTIYNWRKKGYLRDRIIEGSVYFKRTDVMALVDKL